MIGCCKRGAPVVELGENLDEADHADRRDCRTEHGMIGQVLADQHLNDMFGKGEWRGKPGRAGEERGRERESSGRWWCAMR